MSVVLGSEIARLVFGYLQEEQLDEAATAFCKTSPYLKEEYDWLQRGYRVYKISDLCLVDIIREHCEIKYAAAEYIEALPVSLGDTVKTQKSLGGKIRSIFDLLTHSAKPNSTSRKRPYSMVEGAGSTEATQSNELPGYEPPFKERRLSQKLILRQDTAPKQNAIWTPTSKQHAPDAYISDEQDEENISPEQMNSTEKSRNETSQYPIFTETILENTQFQSVLVDNINRILDASVERERTNVSAESGSQESTTINNSLQEHVKHAIDNIIMSTEQDPTFQQVLDDVVQHTAGYEQSVRASSYTNENVNNEKTDSPVPLKQRLRNRSQDKPRPNYAEIDQSTKKKRNRKVEVISNEIVSGEISELLHMTTAVRTDNYVPLNQILYLNSDKTTSTFSGQDLVYVNVGSCVPSFSQFRIDADTPMYVQDISLANNMPSTSLTPGSIINLPTMEQQMQPIQSMLPNVIVKDIVEASKTKQIERSIKTTPNVSKIATQAKARNLTSPRRQSHVRSLNFTTNDDTINETEGPKSKLGESNKKLERTVDCGLASTSQTTSSNETKDSNQKTSPSDVEPQQDSSDAVDFSKEFDEATVISVELSPAAATQPEEMKDEKPAEVSSEKKKPQTRRQCQKDLEMWNQMRQMKKGEWDNYLRQTVASDKTGRSSVDRKHVKKRRTKIRTKSDEANVSAENEANNTTDIQAKLLEEALKSAKKPSSPVNRSNTSGEMETKPNEAEPLKTSPTPAVHTQKTETKNPPSPSKRSSGGRKQLIQIKLPASAKKKPNMSVKRRSRSSTKRVVSLPAETQKPTEETSRIDPSETIDIDLISPIEHPKVLSNPVKSGVNLNSFLETPCKESSSFKYPITPGVIISSSIKTPGIRMNKDYDSMIKFPDYPTPSFAITPGRTKTPMSQSSSQKDGSSYNRATDYSSGSSYYKPDESDDVDRNIDVLIKESVKENRNQIVEIGLGVDPQQHIDSCNDQDVSDGELSDSSSSTSSSSQTSSTSSSSSSPSISDDNRAQAEATENAQRLLIAQRTQQQLLLEQVRLRTMATLKSDNKIERFRKPKTKISTLQRQKVMDGAGIIKKPIQTMKMTGNSTPKVLPKVLPKHVNRPNPKAMTNTPSKRKIATPRRVIYLDYKDTIKTGVRVVTNDKKSAQLQTQSNDNATVDTLNSVQNKNPVGSVTPTETIDAIEDHIAKTCRQNSFVESPAKLTKEIQVDTPNLLQQLQEKSAVVDNASTPEAGPEGSTKREILVRELFGDATMSDSDFMDTPVKAGNTSRGRSISHDASEVAMKRGHSSVKNVVPISNDKSKIVTSTVAVSTHVKDTASTPTPNESKANDTNADDSNAAGSKLSESKIIDPNVTDSKITEVNVAESNVSSSDSKEVQSVDSITRDSNVIQVQHSSKALAVQQEFADNIVPIADDATSTKCNKDHSQSTASDSPSESDDGDDYDDCTLILSSHISNGSNRIYHNVISDSKECAIKLNTDSLDLRPMTTYLGDAKIVIRTCDEVVLFNCPPRPVSPQASTSKTVPKKRINIRAVEGVRKAEERGKKVQKQICDGTDSSTVEKNARFNIIAKHKGPIDTPSAHTSSSRDQRKTVQSSEESQPSAGPSNEIKKASQTKIPPLLKDMDINKVLGKIHPSKEHL